MIFESEAEQLTQTERDSPTSSMAVGQLFLTNQREWPDPHSTNECKVRGNDKRCFGECMEFKEFSNLETKQKARQEIFLHERYWRKIDKIKLRNHQN